MLRHSKENQEFTSCVLWLRRLSMVAILIVSAGKAHPGQTNAQVSCKGTPPAKESKEKMREFNGAARQMKLKMQRQLCAKRSPVERVPLRIVNPSALSKTSTHATTHQTPPETTNTAIRTRKILNIIGRTCFLADNPTAFVSSQDRGHDLNTDRKSLGCKLTQWSSKTGYHSERATALSQPNLKMSECRNTLQRLAKW
jgi:hypothetical protein